MFIYICGTQFQSFLYPLPSSLKLYTYSNSDWWVTLLVVNHLFRRLSYVLKEQDIRYCLSFPLLKLNITS